MIVLSIVLSYLVGSIPFGLVMAKSQHVDLRSIGSGNIGATNVSRALGKKWGYSCFLLDLLKGFIPMVLCLLLIKPWVQFRGLSDQRFFWIWLTIGCAAIVGHIFPIYTGGKGGKGVSTSLGVALGLWPYYTSCALLAFLTWVIFVRLTRTVSLASVGAAFLFPIYLAIFIALKDKWELQTLWPLQVIAILIPLLVIIRHRDNLKRVLTGTENKISEPS